MVDNFSPIGSNFANHAEVTPDKAALIYDHDILNWRDLAEHVDFLARWFDQNVSLHARIGLRLPNSLLLPILFVAVARSGRQAVVIDATLPGHIAQRTLTHADCSLSISFDNMPGIPARHIQLSEHSLLRDNIEKFGNALTEKIENFNIDKPFYLGITSGSSGEPKIYRRNHRSWIESFEIEAIEFGHAANDIVLAPGNLSHSLFLYAITHAMHLGATGVISRQFRPDRVLEYIDIYKPTLLYLVPSQINMLLEKMNSRNSMPKMDLRWLISSGSKWNENQFSRLKTLLPSVKFAEFYGASELSFVSLAREDEAVPVGSVGRVFQKIEIKICDKDGGILPSGETGQIWVRSPMLFSGYTEQDTISNYCDHEGYMSVGDIGYLDSSGFLFLAGRIDRMIVTSGKNLYPEEIEAVLSSHENVAEIAVLSVSDNKRGSLPVALIKFKSDQYVSRAGLIAFARAELPLYKVPRSYFLVEDWLWLRSGKTDFSELQVQHADGRYKAIE